MVIIKLLELRGQLKITLEEYSGSNLSLQDLDEAWYKSDQKSLVDNILSNSKINENVVADLLQMLERLRKVYPT